MKSTGIIRKVDNLGRIVLPIELRRTMDIAERDESFRPVQPWCFSWPDLQLISHRSL